MNFKEQMSCLFIFHLPQYLVCMRRLWMNFIWETSFFSAILLSGLRDSDLVIQT